MNPPARFEYRQGIKTSHSPRRKISDKEAKRFRLAILASVLVLLCRTLLFGGGRGATPPLAQLVDVDTSEQHAYDKAKTILDDSHEELLKALPELRGLEPAQSQKELPEILGRVGANIEALLDGFPNLVSREEVTQQVIRIDRQGSVQTKRLVPFTYMILAHESGQVVHLEEYRTDAKGDRAEPQALEAEFSLTKGFATLWTLFSPGNRSSAEFKLLGYGELEGHKTDVVAFAQRPGWATVFGRVNANGTSIVILYQGIAWIDSVTYQILQMRTDMLAPRWEVGLRRQTTQVDFGEVRLPKVATTLWLPQTVVVTTSLNNEILRNQHRYTDYRLFRVESTVKPVESGQVVPQN